MALLSLLAPRRAGAEPDQAGGIWIITFTDLVGLMLAFFIMMYAMSKLDEERWGRLAAAAGGAPAGAEAATADTPAAPAATAVPAPAHGRDTGYLAALLPGKLAAEPALSGARVAARPGRVAILLPPDAVLADDGATPSARAAGTFAALAAILAGLPNAVRVEASLHGLAQRLQDWTRAAVRATAAAAGLAAAGYAHPLETRAYVVPGTATDDDVIAIVILD